MLFCRKKERLSPTAAKHLKYNKMKRFYRSSQEKILGGVCGGIAEYFNIDPLLVRLFFAILFFGYGTGLLAYLLIWILVPKDGY